MQQQIQNIKNKLHSFMQTTLKRYEVTNLKAENIYKHKATENIWGKSSTLDSESHKSIYVLKTEKNFTFCLIIITLQDIDCTAALQHHTQHTSPKHSSQLFNLLQQETYIWKTGVTFKGQTI